MGNLQKDIILNGSESLAVYKDNGVVYRASDIRSYVPITLRGLVAGIPKRFDLLPVISKDYQVVAVSVDHAFDNQTDNLATQPNAQSYYGSIRVSVIRGGARISHNFTNVYESMAVASGWFLAPGDVMEVNASINLTSVTFWCQPVYLENTIVVPEVISNEPVNSGNENPSPEPVTI